MIKNRAMLDKRNLFVDKLSGFLYGAILLGYDYHSAWQLLLQSTPGRGILNEDYTYIIHFKGIASAEKADEEIGNKFVKTYQTAADIETLKLLSKLIYMAHNDNEFGISFDNMFSKTSIEEFMRVCGVVLGDYDDKLIKRYLL